MPVDWDKFDSEIDSIIERSSDKTDAQLASKVSNITRMTDDEVQELFPKAADAKKVTQLMRIVRSDDDRNKKVNRIVSNAKEFGGVVLTLLEKFA